MKLNRTSIALGAAMLLGTGIAQAQSNVQVYGVVDLGVEHITNIASGGGTHSRSAVSQGSLVASRLGFRGTEDLGGGLRAEFVLESGLSPDAGQLLQGGRLFGRAAAVGLSNQWGRLMLGRQNSALFDLAPRYDPMMYATYSLQGIDSAGFVSRVDNAIKGSFRSGAVSASAFYSFGRDALAGTPAGSQSEVPGASKVGRQLGGNINYSAGAMSIGVAYDQQHGGTLAGSPDTDSRLMLAARYTTGDTTWIAGYLRRENEIPAVDVDSNLYWLGALHQLSPGLRLNLGLYHLRVQDSANRSNRIGASLVKDLSKRTSLYVNAAYVDNKGGSTLGLVSSAATVAGENQTGVVAGVMHRF